MVLAIAILLAKFVAGVVIGLALASIGVETVKAVRGRVD